MTTKTKNNFAAKECKEPIGESSFAISALLRGQTILLLGMLMAGAASATELQDLIHALPDTTGIEEPVGKQESAADLSIWDNAQFQKEFMGSYGVNADIEPRVTTVERDQMEKVMNILSEEDNMDKAMQQLLKSTKDSSSAIFDFTIGNLYFQQDKLSDALAWYDKAIAKFPSFRRANKNAGLIHVRNGDFDKAIPFLTKTIELGGNTSMAYGLLGFAYASTENHLCAESAYRMAILLDPATIDWQLGLARSLFKEQKFGDAVSLCDTLIKKQPDNADFWLLQANAYLGLKQPNRAAENYEYVNALGKGTVQSTTMLADIYVNDSRWDMATDAYLVAYELDTAKSPERPLRAAKILAARGALNESKRLLDRLDADKASLDKKDLVELLKLQSRVAVAEGGGDDVVKILEQVVEVDPLDGEALILLAQHYGRDAPEKAIFYYERAAGIEQYEAEAKLREGQLLVGQSKYSDALPLLRRAYELKPRDDIEDYLKQVERIAKTRG
ncbi:MAG: tetratricopeptide repeat protein [Kiritimatiellales bacterium]|nr:tetratricopeptide repeat protein [Kiritimatiellales bacterium]MCF7864775.1 tetratricopeptide repeat protein [Kiritimatiellales bacterium]